MHEPTEEEPGDDHGANGHGRRPSLWILLAALVGVSAVVLVVALAAPFEPGEADVESVAAGDAARGATLFDDTCAGCHGIAGSGGGIGPTLAGRELAPGAVAGVIESGRGAMPANLLAGADRDDVVAYVVSLGTGAVAAPATSAAGEAASSEAATSEAAPPTEATAADDTARAGDPVAGEAVFEASCAGCHGLDGTGGAGGPELAGADLAADGVKAQVENGGGGMPAGLVEGEDLDNVVAYVLSLSASGAEPGDGSTAVEDTAPDDTAPASTAEAAAPPTGNVALTGAGLVGLQVNLEAPAEVDAGVFLVGPAKKKEIGSIAVGDSELEVQNADVGTILDGYDTVVVGRAADAPLSTAPIGGAVEAMRALGVSSEEAPDGTSLTVAATGQVKVLRDHIRFLKQSLAEGNLINVRFHGEHLVNIVRGEPIVNLDGLGGADNPGDGVGLIGKDGRDGYLPLIAAATAEIAGAAGADDVAAASAEVVGTNAEAAQGLLEAVAANASTCAKAPSLARARLCVRTIDRLEEQVVQSYRLLNRFAARVPVFSLSAFEGS